MIGFVVMWFAGQAALAAPRQFAKIERANELGGRESLLVDCGEQTCQAARTLGKSTRRFPVDATSVRAAIAEFLKNSGKNSGRETKASALRWEVSGPAGETRKGAQSDELKSDADAARLKAVVTLERRLLSLIP